MIEIKEYTGILAYLWKHNPSIRAWYDQYTSIPAYYSINGEPLNTDELVIRLISGNTAELKVPDRFPQNLHNEAVEAIKNIDIQSILLHIRLGVGT